ncbi:MAG: hypothetical protein QM758_06050 [Armatimonas sp.]
MSLTILACAALSIIPVLPFQVDKTDQIRIDKSDTLPDVLNKLRILTKKKIIVDGSIDVSKLNLERIFTYNDFISYLKDELDYDIFVKDESVFLFKSFNIEDTRPDYSVSEVAGSIKDIKVIVEPLMAGNTEYNTIAGLFESAIKGLSPEETQLLSTEKGILIGSLDELTRKKVIEAIYFKEYCVSYFEFSRMLAIINKIDSIKISKNNNGDQILFTSSKNDFNYSISLIGFQKPEKNSSVSPVVYSYLKDCVAKDRSEYSFKLNEEIEDHKIVVVNNAKLNQKEMKVIAELNNWNFKSNIKNDTTVCTVSRAKPGAGITPAARVLQALPGSINRFLLAKLRQEKPKSDSERILSFPQWRVGTSQRMLKMFNNDLLTVSEWLDRKPANSVISIKELPDEIRGALINGMMMRSLYRMNNDLMTNAVRPNSWMVSPEKSYLRCVQGQFGPEFTVLGGSGGLFMVRQRFITSPGQN